MLVLDTDHLVEYQKGTSAESRRWKIASIALANNATLLSRNTTDFQRVPDLRTEDWLS